MKQLIAALAVTTALSAPALAGEFNQPSHDWRGNQAFISKGEGLERLYLREKKDGGFFDQWNVTNNVTATSHHYGDTYARDTYVGNQVNNTAIGSKSTTNVNVEGDGNKVGANADSQNTADTSADQKIKAKKMDGDATNKSDDNETYINDVAGDQKVKTGGGYYYD